MMRLVKWFDARPITGWVAALVALVAAALSASALVANPNTSRDCQANPLRLVYKPHRLRVVQRCVTVAGRVSTVRREHDGDLHIRLDTGGQWLNPVNYRLERGDLVVELMPTDHYATPAVGDQVQLKCTLVEDVGHSGWRECHPAWSETILQGGPGATPPADTVDQS